jgi:hypothetical protein
MTQKIHSPPLDDETWSLASEIYFSLGLYPDHSYSLLAIPKVCCSKSHNSRVMIGRCAVGQNQARTFTMYCAGVRCCGTKNIRTPCYALNLLGRFTLAQNVARCLYYGRYTKSKLSAGQLYVPGLRKTQHVQPGATLRPRWSKSIEPNDYLSGRFLLLLEPERINTPSTSALCSTSPLSDSCLKEY